MFSPAPALRHAKLTRCLICLKAPETSVALCPLQGGLSPWALPPIAAHGLPDGKGRKGGGVGPHDPRPQCHRNDKWVASDQSALAVIKAALGAGENAPG